MIRALGPAGAAPAERSDYLVIGAGIAGLIAADRLARLGYRVTVLESGSERQDEDTHPLNTVEMLGRDYLGARDGRFRCLGGTSTRWGGALIPFQAADLDPALWPIPLTELTPFVAEVEALFGLPASAYDLPDLMGQAADYCARLGKWPAFGKRNVAALLRDRIAGNHGIDVWLNAHVTGFVPGQDRRIGGVRIARPDGTEQTLTADHLLICGGAIESTRLALLLDRALDARLLAPRGVVGRYFHDHLSSRTARITPANQAELNRLAGFRFEGAGMRNLRFELAPATALRRQLPPQFTHIQFSGDEADGFAALRDLFRAVQRKSLPHMATFAQLLRHSPWLARAVWWRFAERRVLAPRGAVAELFTVTEQTPTPDSRITLSTAQSDRFGVPLAAIDWRITERDRAALLASARSFSAAWAASPLARLGSLTPLADDAILAELDNSGGIFHPCGSTRIGAGADQGVVDDQCRVHGLDNVRIFATSVLPTSGGANPTMMMILLTLRALAGIPARG
ncbi:GMC oxidoreductase [Novosphingobium sp. B 225]|uniref:GMC oxidoreductase n=1 Tax=Novosphingobium sp. B 225 TaxID=1961849 RepID=UPI000B4A5D4B|nr:GMC oxidoreductase [Novosphingobium sp. B 225]